MQQMDPVEAVIRAAALEVIGPYGRAKADRIAALATALFRAQGLEVTLVERFEDLEEVARIPGSAELLSFPDGAALPAPPDELDDLVAQAAHRSRPRDAD